MFHIELFLVQCKVWAFSTVQVHFNNQVIHFSFKFDMNEFVHVSLHDRPRYVDGTLFSCVDYRCEHDRFNCDCWGTCILFVDVGSLASAICTAMAFHSSTAFLFEEHQVPQGGTSLFMGKFISKFGLHNIMVMKPFHFC